MQFLCNVTILPIHRDYLSNSPQTLHFDLLFQLSNLSAVHIFKMKEVNKMTLY